MLFCITSLSLYSNLVQILNEWNEIGNGQKKMQIQNNMYYHPLQLLYVNIWIQVHRDKQMVAPTL